MRTSRGELKRRERQLRYATDYATKYPALARRRTPTPALVRLPLSTFSVVSLGHDQDGHTVLLDDTTRVKHVHIVGATGSGKTTALKNIILQDIRRGRGGAIFDPHGGHPGSLRRAERRRRRLRTSRRPAVRRWAHHPVRPPLRTGVTDVETAAALCLRRRLPVLARTGHSGSHRVGIHCDSGLGC